MDKRAGAASATLMSVMPPTTQPWSADLARVVTTYALADNAVALRDVATGAVMKAVLEIQTRA